MKDSKIHHRLEDLSLQDLVDGQRRPGRAEMDPEFVAHWAEQHALATKLLDSPHTHPDTRQLADLLEKITFPIVAQQEDPIPDYYPYTGVHLMDWYLGDRHQSWDRLKAKAAEGVFHTTLDLIRLESQSLAGIEPCHREHFDREIVTQRLQVLERAGDKCRDLGRALPEADLDRSHGPRHYKTLGEYATEPSRVSAMVEFSMMPQTRFHDEVIFLRTIHIAEFCFYGIRMAVREARELLRRGLIHAASLPLRQAVAFGAMLYESFKVLRTMPPAHFKDFRDATGKASAIKSLNYQLLEIHLRGVNSEKVSVFQRIPHLRELTKYAHPGFVSMRSVLKKADPEAPGWDDVFELARALDQKWLTWRGLHLSFALHYLPQHVKGTGDTEGAPYLRKFLRSGMFDDTKVDLDVVEEMFANHPEIPNLFRAKPSVGLSPAADELRAYRES